MKKYLILMIPIVFFEPFYGQNNSYFNDFFDNSHFNTAFNGLSKKYKFSFLGYKNQSLSNTPGLYTLTAAYTNKDQITFGTRLLTKNLGVQNYYIGELNITKRLALSKSDSLSFAVSLGGAMNSYNPALFNSYTEADPVIANSTSPYFTSGSGILYTHKDILEIGASAPILANGIYGLNPLWFFSTRYHIHFSKYFILSPQVLYELNNYADQFDFSSQLRYRNNYWMKVAYNTNNTITVGLGIRHNFMDFGYAYKIHRENYGNNILGLHHLSVTMYLE